MIEKIKHHFDAAHRLSNYEGACNNIHGHRWDVEITLQGEVDGNTDMIVDFKIIKKIIDSFDHCIILKEYSGNEPIIKACQEMNLRCHLMANEPTAENLVVNIFRLLRTELKGYVSNLKVELWESPGCSVVFGDDI